MRILFITNIPSPYRVNFFNLLNEENEVFVLFERPSDSDRNKLWQKDNKYKFKYKINVSNKELINTIKEYRNDKIIITNYSEHKERIAILYMKLHKIPYYIEIDGGIIKKDNFIKGKIKRFLLSNAHGYFSPSKNADNYLINYGAAKEIINRYNFSSLNKKDILEKTVSREEKEKIRKKLKIKEENVVIGVGSFTKRKGFDLLIKAAPKINKKTGVYIIGGEITDEYKELIRNYNVENVHFIKFLSKEAINEYYKAADIFVLPTREDIWGLVINEAMSFGLPVITTDNCLAGLALIKNGENGYIIPVDSYVDIYKNVNKILDNNKLKEKMSENNLKKITNYTIEDMVEKHNKLLK